MKKNTPGKLLLLLTFLVFQQILFAGPRPSGKIVRIRATYFVPAASYHFLPLGSLNVQVKSLGTSSGFSNPIGLGIDYGGHYSSTRYDPGACSLYSFHLLLPQTIKSANDSIRFLMKGYNAQFDFINTDFVKTQRVTFTAGLSWSFGRLKVVEETAGASSSFYNPYFAPQLRTELTIWVSKHFVVGVRAAYRHDISKTGWKQTGAPRPDPLAGTRFSGTTAGFYLGYGY